MSTTDELKQYRCFIKEENRSNYSESDDDYGLHGPVSFAGLPSFSQRRY
jgi:hypothetical protein